MDLEHPEITETMRSGYPQGEPNYPHCPVCGCECDEVYVNDDREVVGCNECISTKSAWFMDECFDWR